MKQFVAEPPMRQPKSDIFSIIPGMERRTEALLQRIRFRGLPTKCGGGEG
jgi:hypothetical protein